MFRVLRRDQIGALYYNELVVSFLIVRCMPRTCLFAKVHKVALAGGKQTPVGYASVKE
jgi:hypothetical protein